MPTHNNQTYDYFRGDYVALNDYFSTIDWDLLFDGNSISLNWNVFKEKIFEGCQKFIPMSSVSYQKSSPPWWTKALSRRKGHCILNTGQPNLQLITATMLLNKTWLKLKFIQPK